MGIEEGSKNTQFRAVVTINYERGVDYDGAIRVESGRLAEGSAIVFGQSLSQERVVQELYFELKRLLPELMQDFAAKLAAPPTVITGVEDESKSGHRR